MWLILFLTVLAFPIPNAIHCAANDEEIVYVRDMGDLHIQYRHFEVDFSENLVYFFNKCETLTSSDELIGAFCRVHMDNPHCQSYFGVAPKSRKCQDNVRTIKDTMARAFEDQKKRAVLSPQKREPIGVTRTVFSYIANDLVGMTSHLNKQLQMLKSFTGTELEKIANLVVNQTNRTNIGDYIQSLIIINSLISIDVNYNYDRIEDLMSPGSFKYLWFIRGTKNFDKTVLRHISKTLGHDEQLLPMYDDLIKNVRKTVLVNETHYTVRVEIPIVSKQQYKLKEIVPLPFTKNKRPHAVLLNDNSIVELANGSIFMMPDETQRAQKCMLINDWETICDHSITINWTKPTPCIERIITKNESLDDTCDYRELNLYDNHMTKLSPSKVHWYIVEPFSFNLMCLDGKNVTISLPHSGIYNYDQIQCDTKLGRVLEMTLSDVNEAQWKAYEEFIKHADYQRKAAKIQKYTERILKETAEPQKKKEELESFSWFGEQWQNL